MAGRLLVVTLQPAVFISRAFCDKKLLKNLADCSGWSTVLCVGWETGGPRANASEDEEVVIPGGGGVG